MPSKCTTLASAFQIAKSGSEEAASLARQISTTRTRIASGKRTLQLDPVAPSWQRLEEEEQNTLLLLYGPPYLRLQLQRSTLRLSPATPAIITCYSGNTLDRSVKIMMTGSKQNHRPLLAFAAPEESCRCRPRRHQIGQRWSAVPGTVEQDICRR